VFRKRGRGCERRVWVWMEQVEERLDELAYLEDKIWKEERNTAKNEKEVRPPPLCQSLSICQEASERHASLVCAVL